MKQARIYFILTVVALFNVNTGCKKMLEEKPKATITPTGTVYMCNGQTTLLTANSGNGLSHQWLKNGAMINGATNSIYNASTAGTYKVTVTKNSTGCSKTSVVTKVKINCRLDESDDVTPVLVYPNPSSSHFHLKITKPGKAEIMDLSGKIKDQFFFSSGERDFGETLPPGIFLVRLSFDDGSIQTVKVIKE